ncbi:MAG: hypothetical protein ACYSWU_21270, partial [Planctomycetota bacterium]
MSGELLTRFGRPESNNSGACVCRAGKHPLSLFVVPRFIGASAALLVEDRMNAVTTNTSLRV